MLPENVIPDELNLIIYQGATFSRTIQFYDDGGQIISLAGCTAAAKIRKTFPSADPVVAFTVTVAATSVKISLTKTQTADLEGAGGTNNRLVDLGYWDLEISDGTRTERPHEGKVQLSREATK